MQINQPQHHGPYRQLINPTMPIRQILQSIKAFLFFVGLVLCSILRANLHNKNTQTAKKNQTAPVPKQHTSWRSC